MYRKHPIVLKAVEKINKDIKDEFIGIRGKLYNIDNFNHPGGNTFININKGTDATTLFETHHINIKLAEKYLDSIPVVGEYKPKFKYNFNRYNFIRDKVYNLFKTRKSRMMNIKTKIKLFSYISLSAYLNYKVLQFNSFSLQFIILCIFNSIFNSVLGGFGHNGLHKLEYSTFLLDFNGLSTIEWLMEHVSSHHMYTNTKYDHDTISMQPYLNWIPSETNSLFNYRGKHLIYLIAEIAVSIQGLFGHRFRFKLLFDNNYPIYIRFSPLIFILRIFTHIYFQGFIFGVMTLLINLSFAGYYFSNLAHLNHASLENTYKETEIDYIEQQLKNTNDIYIMDYFNEIFLNLSKQTYHHLFPTLDHCHLHKINDILLSENINVTKKNIYSLNNMVNKVLKKYS